MLVIVIACTSQQQMHGGDSSLIMPPTIVIECYMTRMFLNALRRWHIAEPESHSLSHLYMCTSLAFIRCHSILFSVVKRLLPVWLIAWRGRALPLPRRASLRLSDASPETQHCACHRSCNHQHTRCTARKQWAREAAPYLSIGLSLSGETPLTRVTSPHSLELCHSASLLQDTEIRTLATRCSNCRRNSCGQHGRAENSP